MYDTMTLKSFWNWFLENEEKFFYYERYQQTLLPETLDRIQEIQPDLVFEIGPEIDGKREFVISANGMKEGFASVIELARLAPEHERWTIVPFRQRKKNLDMQIQIGDLVLGTEDIFFNYTTSKDRFNLNLYIADVDPADEKVYHVALLLLDNIIGEFDVEMKLSTINVFALTSDISPEHLYELKDLPGILDQFYYKKVD